MDKPTTTIAEDIEVGSDWMVRAFKSLGLNLDYSVDSVKHVDKLLDDQFENGIPVANGLFSENMGKKLFSLGAYVGKVVIANVDGTSWSIDEDDPAQELNARIVSSGGMQMFPVQRVIKRVKNGAEDSIYIYVRMAVSNYMISSNTSSEAVVGDNDVKVQRPWWKFRSELRTISPLTPATRPCWLIARREALCAY